MIIYIDIIIFLNFIINYCFIKLIYLLFKEKVNKKRIITSSILSVLLLLSFFTNYIVFNIVKIFGGLLLVFVGIKYSNKKRFIIMSCLYYLLQYSFIGVLSIYNVKGCLIFVLLLLICILMIICMKKSHIYDKKTYKVIIKLFDEEVMLDGFVDTGNMASYYDTPIIFIDKKYYNNNLIIEHTVELKTINDRKYVNCYKPKEFYIIDNNKKISKDVLISFSKFDNDFECILNNLLFN